MSLLHKTPSPSIVLRSIATARVRQSAVNCNALRFASGESSSQQQTQNQDSKSKDSSSSKPQPKILSASPPQEGDQPEDVARHNREMESRMDRPAEKVKDEDLEKDKVNKGFWSGTSFASFPCD